MACPIPAIRTMGRPADSATSLLTSSTAAPPSETGQQSKKRIGSATHGLLVIASGESRIPSIVIGCCRWANSLRKALFWFLTATIARCRSVTPYFSMYSRVNMAAWAGSVTP